MLMDRIMKVFTFKTEVYAEVEKDTSFTQTAWIIVAATNILNQIGVYFAATAGVAAASAFAADAGVVVAAPGPLSIVTGTVAALVGFAVGAYVVAFVGKSMFQADVTFDEVVRVMGLASVWGILGIAGLLGAVVPLLICIISPLLLAGVVLSIASSAIAIKEALDLDWTKTIITVVISWIAIFIVSAVVNSVLSFVS
jgi:hypothetical protein